MSDEIYDALSRAAQLIRLDLFDGNADDRLIVDGLRSTGVRIVADRANLATPEAQTAFVTLYLLLAMMGLQIEVEIPSNVSLVAPQPPLVGDDLLSAVRGHFSRLFPVPQDLGLSSTTPDATFAMGTTPAQGPCIRVGAGGWLAQVGAYTAEEMPRWSSTVPFGALAAAAAAAADGFRAAVPYIAAALGRALPARREWRLDPARQTSIDLSHFARVLATDIGRVDVVSGGAITNALLYCLLRVPDLTGQLRVIEDDHLDVSNLNRYVLATSRGIRSDKVGLLAAFATDDLSVTVERVHFDASTAEALRPLASRFAVGVDDIPSRWAVQQASPDAGIIVGATSHDFVVVSAHPPGTPCSGCVHPRDEPAGVTVPTISFVSFWAGLVQALYLLTGADREAWARTTIIWPLGLDGARGIHEIRQAGNPQCPLQCRAAQRADAMA